MKLKSEVYLQTITFLALLSVFRLLSALQGVTW